MTGGSHRPPGQSERGSIDGIGSPLIEYREGTWLFFTNHRSSGTGTALRSQSPLAAPVSPACLAIPPLSRASLIPIHLPATVRVRLREAFFSDESYFRTTSEVSPSQPLFPATPFWILALI